MFKQNNLVLENALWAVKFNIYMKNSIKLTEKDERKTEKNRQKNTHTHMLVLIGWICTPTKFKGPFSSVLILFVLK